MAKIRELGFLDIPKLSKLVSCLDLPVKSIIDGIILPYPLNVLYGLIPMRLKFLQESYVLIDNNEVQAFISVKKMRGNHRKWRISKLLLGQNAHEAGLLLLQYVISKFGAKGAHTFVASMEETQGEFISLFVEGAGFRQCSRRQLWRATDLYNTSDDFGELIVRPFKNSDAQNVATLFNEATLPYFRPSIACSKQEFYEYIFSGLSATTEFKYVVEDSTKKQILGYFTLRTSDNKNYLLAPVITKGFEYLYEPIISYSIKQAQRRTKEINFFIVNRYYMQTGNDFENILKDKGYQPASASTLLIKDLFRTVKNENAVNRPVFYTEIGSNPAFKS